jgi:hypothetical protein
LVPGFPVPDPAQGVTARVSVYVPPLDVKRNARPPSKFSSGMQQAGAKYAGFVHRWAPGSGAAAVMCGAEFFGEGGFFVSGCILPT